jgi:hypothetical protein
MCVCVCLEATSEHDLSVRLSIVRSGDLAEIPVLVADYVDRYGWSFVEAEHELGEVLIATGVYDKIQNVVGLS